LLKLPLYIQWQTRTHTDTLTHMYIVQTCIHRRLSKYSRCINIVSLFPCRLSLFLVLLSWSRFHFAFSSFNPPLSLSAPPFFSLLSPPWSLAKYGRSLGFCVPRELSECRAVCVCVCVCVCDNNPRIISHYFIFTNRLQVLRYFSPVPPPFRTSPAYNLHADCASGLYIISFRFFSPPFQTCNRHQHPMPRYLLYLIFVALLLPAFYFVDFSFFPARFYELMKLIVYKCVCVRLCVCVCP